MHVGVNLARGVLVSTVSMDRVAAAAGHMGGRRLRRRKEDEVSSTVMSCTCTS